jgi:hypothetical protein
LRQFAGLLSVSILFVMKLFLYLLLLACAPTLTDSCGKHQQHKSAASAITASLDTLLDYGYFTIRVPKGFANPDSAIQRRTGKSLAYGGIVNGESNFLGYDIGDNYMQDVSFPDPLILTEAQAAYYLHDGADTAYSIISNRPDTIDKERMKFYHTHRDTINGIGVKVFYPRVTGYGFCGIYSDSIPASSPLLIRGKRFRIIARDADSAHQALVFQCIKTIQFK